MEKKYLDLTGLTKYDQKIKQYVDDSVADVHKPQVYEVNGLETTNIDGAVATLTDVSFANGDILIIKDNNGIKASYQYDDDNDPHWCAFLGNVNANNVILANDITLAGNYTSVGNITKTQTGTGTLSAQGKSVATVLTNIFTKELTPTKTEPAVTLAFPEAKAYEVGTTVTPTYTATLSAGSYTYGPATGITATAWEVKDTDDNTLTTATGTFPQITVADDTRYSITATATHGEGTASVTNLGNSSTVKIAAGTKSKTVGTITGFRYWFAGALTTAKDALVSDDIRALNKVTATSSAFNVTIPEGAKEVIIAVPTGKTLKSVADQNAFGTDIVSSFVSESVNVEGANGFTAKAYTVYVYKPSAALGANTYKVTIK